MNNSLTMICFPGREIVSCYQILLLTGLFRIIIIISIIFTDMKSLSGQQLLATDKDFAEFTNNSKFTKRNIYVYIRYTFMYTFMYIFMYTFMYTLIFSTGTPR